MVLNAAAFYYDFDDLQVDTVKLGGGVDVANAPKAELDGIDAESSLEISDRLAVSGGVVWMPKREFVQFINDLGQDLSGNKLVLAPEWAASAAITYEQPLRDLGRLSTRLEYATPERPARIPERPA